MLQHVLIIVSKDCIELWSFLSGRIPEHGIHRGRVHNFVRVENILRVPAFLDGLEKFIIMITYHLFYKLASQPAIPMFSAQRALVFFYQPGYFCSDGTEHLVSFFRLEVDNGSQMNFT